MLIEPTYPGKPRVKTVTAPARQYLGPERLSPVLGSFPNGAERSPVDGQDVEVSPPRPGCGTYADAECAVNGPPLASRRSGYYRCVPGTAQPLPTARLMKAWMATAASAVRITSAVSTRKRFIASTQCRRRRCGELERHGRRPVVKLPPCCNSNASGSMRTSGCCPVRAA